MANVNPGYAIPSYGKTACGMLQTSQITHFGIVVKADSNDDPAITFYEKVLKLLRARDCRDPCEYNPGEAASEIWEFKPGQKNYNVDLDDARSSTDYRFARSGRLKIVRVPTDDVRLRIQQSSLPRVRAPAYAPLLLLQPLRSHTDSALRVPGPWACGLSHAPQPGSGQGRAAIHVLHMYMYIYITCI